MKNRNGSEGYFGRGEQGPFTRDRSFGSERVSGGHSFERDREMNRDEDDSEYGVNTQGMNQNWHPNYGQYRTYPEGKGHYGKGPKNFKRSDDRVKEEVSEILWRHSDIDASDVEVEVKEGVVTVSGTVDARETRRMVEREIENVAGVRDVKNELSIRPVDSGMM